MSFGPQNKAEAVIGNNLLVKDGKSLPQSNSDANYNTNSNNMSLDQMNGPKKASNTQINAQFEGITQRICKTLLLEGPLSATEITDFVSDAPKETTQSILDVLSTFGVVNHCTQQKQTDLSSFGPGDGKDGHSSKPQMTSFYSLTAFSRSPQPANLANMMKSIEDIERRTAERRQRIQSLHDLLYDQDMSKSEKRTKAMEMLRNIYI
jgi:hypothetical protein